MQEFPEKTARFILNTENGSLELATELPDNAKPITFVMCHPHPLYQGTMDNKVVTMTVNAFKSLGLATVRFNYRGVGKSTGVYGEGIGETEDLLSVLKWVQAVRPGPIWLGGFSFGGYVAYRGAGQDAQITQLLTLAPGITRFDMQGLPEPTVPWLIVQSDADEVIPAQAVYDWLAGLKTHYDLIKLSGVSHFFHGELVTLRDLLVEHYRDKVDL